MSGIDLESILAREVSLEAIPSPGPGGQNVNKVATAIHLRFDIHASSLPGRVKQRLLKLRDKRISADGIIVIKAQNHRTQERNRAEALERLQELVKRASQAPRRRIPTQPTRAAKRRRLDEKKKRGELKKQRGKPDY